MKLKTRFLIIFIIFSFLSSLFSFFPIQKAHALWITCGDGKYEDWKDLPPIDFSVDKINNDTFTASITSPKSVMDRWATRAPNKDFMILAFNGNVAYGNKLDFNIGKAILYNNATNSYTPQTFTITGYDPSTGKTLGPGTYEITFRIFPEPVPSIQAGEESLNGCAIDSGPISRSLTIPQPAPPPDGNPPPDGSNPPPDGSNPPPPDTNCTISGNECAEGFVCIKATGMCLKVDTTIKCDIEKCPSGVCKDDGTCDTALVPFACSEDPFIDKGGIYFPDAHTYNFTCNTAIGNIKVNPEGFAQSLLKLLLGLAGGLLLVLIIINGYKFMTSQGDPEKIKDAREGIIAAIAGILLIIFSLSILQLITADIIGIPGFG